MSALEIAERLHLKSAGLVNGWRRRYGDFPEPVAKLGVGSLWYWPDVEKWARLAGPRREQNTRHPRR